MHFISEFSNLLLLLSYRDNFLLMNPVFHSPPPQISVLLKERLFFWIQEGNNFRYSLSEAPKESMSNAENLNDLKRLGSIRLNRNLLKSSSSLVSGIYSTYIDKVGQMIVKESVTSKWNENKATKGFPSHLSHHRALRRVTWDIQ